MEEPLNTSGEQGTEKQAQIGDGKRTARIMIAAIVCFTVICIAGMYFFSRDDEPVVYYYETVPSDAETEISSSVFTAEYDSSYFVSSTVSAVKTNADTQISSSVAESVSKTDSDSSQAEETTREEENTEVTFPIEINCVTFEQLILINGVGEITAQKIIDFRSQVSIITSMEMLVEINGIGEGTVNMLKEYLYVDDAYYQPYQTETVTTTTTTAQTTTSPPQTEAQTKRTTRTTTSKATTTTTTTTESTSSAEAVRHSVNINTATAEELAEALLITDEQAQEIVEFRGQIQYYSSVEELLYLETLSKDEIREIKDYIIIEKDN